MLLLCKSTPFAEHSIVRARERDISDCHKSVCVNAAIAYRRAKYMRRHPDSTMFLAFFSFRCFFFVQARRIEFKTSDAFGV